MTLESTQKKLYELRLKNKGEKAQKLSKHYLDKLTEYINTYFNN